MHPTSSLKCYFFFFYLLMCVYGLHFSPGISWRPTDSMSLTDIYRSILVYMRSHNSFAATRKSLWYPNFTKESTYQESSEYLFSSVFSASQITLFTLTIMQEMLVICVLYAIWKYDFPCYIFQIAISPIMLPGNWVWACL